jgi:hypothetical protein
MQGEARQSNVAIDPAMVDASNGDQAMRSDDPSAGTGHTLASLGGIDQIDNPSLRRLIERAGDDETQNNTQTTDD